MSFATLGLDPRILSAVTAQGYHTPTPIQQQTIPVILEGKDVLAGAQTGTGKTAAFTLPVLQLLSKNTSKVNNLQVRCLVLTPTRELAQQVADSVKAYGADLPLKYAVFYGGVSINPQYDQASRGLDILVATPGRLLDHLHQGTVSLSELQILVLDEADRMLDMGFIHDIKRIMARLPKERQTLFFSATFAKEIKELADTLLKFPVLIEVAKPNSTADKVEQLAYRVDSQRKREMLSYLIGSRQWKQVLIFSRTKHGADRLAKQLRLDGIEAGAIHGDKSQGARTKALDDFKNNRLSVLVATDIAARGLDIEELPIVVNYDLPQVAEDYVHRIGRTGRAGNSGMAISLITPDDLVMLQAIEKLTKQVIVQQVIPGYEHDPKMNHSSKKADAEEERVQKVASRNKQLAKEKAKLRSQLVNKK
ncbi:DEAD/DEAH box helicase [Rheinheimera sp. 1928-s]|uniref:DEAD/DEAH box helicase n=1 Tax=Rheinheimera sp. 1928-s TaxID=3033803 RepID=UPI002633F047|nr:DEAD/DEAH box helicase [Rheinheimera sp. 1928-s]MDF3124114.1 DEAD/DEAH box helicase [Rheinheimera sp. 1928-s]